VEQEEEEQEEFEAQEQEEEEQEFEAQEQEEEEHDVEAQEQEEEQEVEAQKQEEQEDDEQEEEQEEEQEKKEKKHDYFEYAVLSLPTVHDARDPLRHAYGRRVSRLLPLPLYPGTLHRLPVTKTETRHKDDDIMVPCMLYYLKKKPLLYHFLKS